MDDPIRAASPASASRIQPSESSAGGVASRPTGSRMPPAPPPPDVALSGPGADAEAAASRSLLADAVSHELRSTLALISGYSQSLLHLQLDDGTQRRYLSRISQAAESLTELADEVLDLAAVDEGEILHRQPVSLAWLVERLSAEVAQEDGGIVIEREVPLGLPLVLVDPVWIAHVLRNLVVNAAVYGGDGARVLRIQARDDDDHVVMTVHDDGAGIDPEEREHVFDPFFRGRRARESGTEGAGLGLYLCRQLVEAHGGRIWIDDAPQGAAISFSLPRGRTGEAPAGGAARADATMDFICRAIPMRSMCIPTSSM